MKLFVIFIFISQLISAAELGIVLSKNEVQNLNALYPQGSLEHKFSQILSDFNLEISCSSNEKNSKLLLSGEQKDLKLAEYLYYFWLKDLSGVELQFSHFEGSPQNRIVKRQFSKRLLLT